jgi:DNA replication protein DnaC
LNQKLTNARKYGNVASVTNGLVRPSCLIIDEVGRCVFDEANTQIFFDIIDRRSNKGTYKSGREMTYAPSFPG